MTEQNPDRQPTQVSDEPASGFSLDLPYDSDVEQLVVPPPRPEERTSERLRRLLGSLEARHVHVGYLVIQLRRRSFGGLFVLLAAIGLLPGISLFAGMIMLVPALQMACGFRAPALPRFLGRRVVSVDGLRAVVGRLLPWLERLERHVQPRWPLLTQPPLANLAGLMIAGLGVAMLLPLPLSNLPPAVAILLLALGLLERDGIVMLVGLVFGAVALAVGTVIGLASLEAATLLIDSYLYAD
jgi:hypothetical protein